MALDGDPYRILGLTSGAPLVEVKRAYRRLAKEYHPDTAGEAAMPRFLAIQAAYEALVGPDGRGRRRPGVARQAPWQADPDRARGAREAWRARRGRPGGRPNAGPDPASAGAADAGHGTRRRRTTGTRRPGAPDRPPNRATPGSTSYDFAEQDPHDPDWSGASWYGQSSGTYWTINPKEYADPRKHGPEYQARGRRRSAQDEPGEAPPRPDPAEAPPGPDPAEAPPGPDPAEAPPRPDPGETAPPEAGDWHADRDPPAYRAPRARSPRPAAHAPEAEARPDRAGRSVEETLNALAAATGAGGRVTLALVGWPPIGLAVALAIGELSGCGRFSASCVEVFSVGSWVAQAVVIGILLLLPALAGIAAVGSIAVLAASIPAAVVLSAVGGSRAPGAAGGVLLVVLAAAWIAGVGVGILRRSRRVGA